MSEGPLQRLESVNLSNLTSHIQLRTSRQTMSGALSIHFKADVWRYESKGGWYFVSLPEEDSARIREIFKSDIRAKEGIDEGDEVRVEVRI